MLKPFFNAFFLFLLSPKVDALKQCLEHTMPAVAREQAFFSTLFGLDPAKEPQDRDAVHK